MPERIKLFHEISCYSTFKLILVLIFKLELVVSFTNKIIPTNISNHSCYACIEPLLSYIQHSDSCKYLNVSSPLALTYIKECNENSNDDTSEYECRKTVISYRSVETYLRRDCVRKGSCSWKDRTNSMKTTPVSDCVYTDEHTQKLECVYCCDTPLCNQTKLFSMKTQFLFCLLMIYVQKFILS